MILNAIAEKLKRQSKDDFKGRHFEAWLIVQAVAWYLRYPLSYRDLEEMFRERGFEVDHSTINRWVLAYAPVIEKRLRQFRRPHCGSVRIDETYVKIRGKWRYLYRAIDKHGNPMTGDMIGVGGCRSAGPSRTLVRTNKIIHSGQAVQIHRAGKCACKLKTALTPVSSDPLKAEDISAAMSASHHSQADDKSPCDLWERRFCSGDEHREP